MLFGGKENPLSGGEMGHKCIEMKYNFIVTYMHNMHVLNWEQKPMQELTSKHKPIDTLHDPV